jgi:hypothetical protein
MNMILLSAIMLKVVVPKIMLNDTQESVMLICCPAVKVHVTYYCVALCQIGSKS